MKTQGSGADEYFFFFNDTATTEIYTLSLHDALPIFAVLEVVFLLPPQCAYACSCGGFEGSQREIVERALSSSEAVFSRSEEHTSELQSRQYLVCRLLLEKKNTHLHHIPYFASSPTRY